MAYATAVSDDLLQPFWAAAQDGRLIIQACRRCGQNRFPPTAVCPACLSNEQEWVAASGKATLESKVQFHRAYWPDRADQIPYTVCLVRLAEGPLMLSNFAAGDDETPLGSELEVCFEARADGLVLPQFRRSDRTR